MMTMQAPFKWCRFEAEIILLCVRWYLRYALSYRDMEEIMQERGLHVDHTTIYRWVQHYALNWRSAAALISKGRLTRGGWIDVCESQRLLGLPVPSTGFAGRTLEFLLSPTRDAPAAKRFFAKALRACHTVIPRVITVDKNVAYPKALRSCKRRGFFRNVVNCGKANA